MGLKFRRGLSEATDTVVDVRQDLRILSDRRFARLLGARTCSVLGSAFGPVALAFGVLGLPGATATTLSLVVFAESLSMVVFMLLGGVIADRLPRFRVMVAADAGAALAWGLLAAMLITGWAPVGVLVALAALAGVATALFFPAFTGVVPEVVPAANLQSANGILRLGMNAARIGGFTVAGAAVALLGAGWAMALNACLLVASALLLAGMRLPTTTRGEPGHMLRDLREGWREFRSRQWLWVVVVQYTFVVMAVQAIWGVFGPVVAKQRYDGAKGWSLVLAAESVGMVVGVFLAIRARPRRPIRMVVLMSFPLASLPVALGLGAPLPVAVLASLVGGVALDILSVLWETTMQREIPPAALSRVSSYDALGSLMFGPVGLMLAGPAVSLLGIRTALLVSAGIMTVASLAALCSPGVNRLQWTDRSVESPRAEPSAPDQPARAAQLPAPAQLGVPVAVVGTAPASGVREPEPLQLELLEVGGRQAAHTSSATG
jgi:MFS family permease